MDGWMDGWMHASIYLFIYLSIYLSIYPSTYLSTYLCTHTHTHTYIHTYIYIYVCVYKLYTLCLYTICTISPSLSDVLNLQIPAGIYTVYLLDCQVRDSYCNYINIASLRAVVPGVKNCTQFNGLCTPSQKDWHIHPHTKSCTGCQ